MMNPTKIIPIVACCLICCYKIQAQIIFNANFNDTSFYKSWKVSENIEHAKKSDINQTQFLKLHPVYLDEYIQSPRIALEYTGSYAILYDWKFVEQKNIDSVQLLLSKNNGNTWKIIRILKKGHPQFWLRDSISLGTLNANDSVVFRWQYFASNTYPNQSFNLDNVKLLLTKAYTNVKTSISTFDATINLDVNKHKIKVVCSNTEGKAFQLSMYTTKGVVLKNTALPVSKKNKIEIDVSDVSNGLYFISIELNNEVYTRAIVIQ